MKTSWGQLSEAAENEGAVSLAELRAWCAADLGRRGLLTKVLAGNVRGTLSRAAAVARGKKEKEAQAKYRFDGGRATMRFERALKRDGARQMEEKSRRRQSTNQTAR